MTEATHESLLERCGDTTPRDRRNLWRLLLTVFGWAICFVGASQLIKRGLIEGPAAWLVATLPMIAGVVVIAAYGRYLRELDELQRMIQLQALALAFGGTFFAYAGYQVFERLGAPRADSLAYTIVWTVLFLAWSIRGWRHYR